MLFAPDESLESNWDQLFRQSETAFQEKNYALAESTLHAALKECANFAENDRRIAETLLKLGKVYLLQNNYQLAEDFFQRSLEMCKAEAGEEALELEPYLASLAHLYRNQRLYEKGEKAMIEIVKIKEKHLGTEHVDVAESLEHLAIYYQFWYTAEDGHSNPEALFRRSLKIKEAALGAENPETLRVLQSLANYLQSEKQYALSEELLARLISARKNTLGDHHPDVAAAQIALADVYKAQKKYADPIYNEILVKAKGPHELEEAATVSMLAKHFRYVTDYKTKVPELYMRSLAIKEKLFGAYHIDLAEDIDELASFYQLQKNYADAAHLLERLCKIYFDNLGPEASDLQRPMHHYPTLTIARLAMSKHWIWQKELSI